MKWWKSDIYDEACPITCTLKEKIKKREEAYAKNSGVASSTFLPFCSITTTVMSSPSL